jgi:hypothetical protein
VPVWVRPAEEGMTRLPIVVVQYAGDVKGRWEGQVAVNSAEAIAAFAGERWEGWVALASGVTTTSTVPIWRTTPQWCNETGLPGSHVAEGVFDEFSLWPDSKVQFGYIFIRILEFLEPERVIVERSAGYSPLPMDLSVIRASVWERDGEAYNEEFVLGIPTSFSLSGEMLESGLILRGLRARRVPFDDCPKEDLGGRALIPWGGSWDTDALIGEVLRVGWVYPVAVVTGYDCTTALDNHLCEYRQEHAVYGTQLIDRLESGEFGGSTPIGGRVMLWGVFVPDGWCSSGCPPPESD